MPPATTLHPNPHDRGDLSAQLHMGLLFFAACACFYLYDLRPGPGLPRDGSSLVVGRDFLNFWMYGRAAASADPGAWYDPAVYQHALAALLGETYPGQNWSYPPSVMLIARPFAALPYLAALACWTLTGVVVFAATTGTRFGARALVVALVSPAAIFCVISGQSSLLTAAAAIGAFALLDRRPLAAGLLIGCLTLKPQLGLLFPVMLIASGHWRTFWAAAAATVVIAAVATAVHGTQIWLDFVTKGLEAQGRVLLDHEGIATPFYPTVFMNLRGVGSPYGLAMAAQALFALVAAAIVWWAFRRRREADPNLLAALFFACSVAATPYLLVYDTLALATVSIALLAKGALDGSGATLAKLVYWLPLLQMALGEHDIPGPALIAPIFALHLAAKLRASETSYSRSALSLAQ